MQLSEQELHRSLREIDDQHQEGMATMPDDIRTLHSELVASGPPRWLDRPRVGAIALGALMVPLAALWSASTVSAAAGDAAIAAFAESVELAAVQAYLAAAKSGKVTTKGLLDAATMFAGHHQEHAAAFASAAGTAATNKPNPKLLQAIGDQIAGAANEQAIITIAFDLENAAAATYMFALGVLTSTAALQLTASILPVEAQHAVVLGQVLGKAGKDLVPPFQTADAAVDPTKFPI